MIRNYSGSHFLSNDGERGDVSNNLSYFFKFFPYASIRVSKPLDIRPL